jgi:hypothetical protein
MAQAQPRHICFYSNKDKWSAAFLEELKKTPWVPEFRFVCVDPSPDRPKLPPWLKQVPTLVITGNPEPLVDSDVMYWLYERKMKDMPNKSSAPSGPCAAVSGGSSAAGAGGVDPMSWNDGEMGGFGNCGYTFLDTDCSAQGNGGETIPGAFSFLNGGSSPGDRSGQSAIASTNPAHANAGRTKKEIQFDSMMEQYKQNRDFGMPQGPKRQ